MFIATGLHVDAIPEQSGKGFKLGDQKFFAVKKNGQLFVYRNSCPHIGIALEWVEDQFLDSSKSMIQCANHGALFVIESGHCVSGPCSGQKLRKIQFQLIDGEIHIDSNEI